MLRLSKLTDYAIVVLARLGHGGVRTAPDLAATTGIGEATVSKVLKILAHAGLVVGLRGSRGGYRLTRPLSAMALSDVVVALEGPIALTACVDGATGGCEAEASCPVRGRWDPVNDAIRSALAAVTIADLADDPCASHRPRAALQAALAAE